MAPPTTTSVPTILSLKQNFLTTQTRLLSQAPEPSRAWRRRNTDNSADGGLVPEKALNDALYRLNHTIQQHARRVYAPQATRHVAEQIDRLYLNVGESPRGGEGEAGDHRESNEDGEGDVDEDAWRMVGADYGELLGNFSSSSPFSPIVVVTREHT